MDERFKRIEDGLDNEDGAVVGANMIKHNINIE